METQHIPIQDLSVDPANARSHNSRNIEAIKSSLVKFGQQKPIVVNAKNEVIAGNKYTQQYLAESRMLK